MTGKIAHDSQFIRYVRELATKGEPGAQFVLVFYLASRHDAGKYRKTCMELLHRLSLQGNSLADYAIGNWHLYGLGVRKSQEKAFRYLLAAARKGHPAAQYDVGVCFSRGAGTRKSYKEAAKWFGKAAAGGDGAAQLELGLCYFHGAGVPRSLQRAIHWYKLAVRNGNKEARIRLQELKKLRSVSFGAHEKRNR